MMRQMIRLEPSEIVKVATSLVDRANRLRPPAEPMPGSRELAKPEVREAIRQISR